MRVLHIDIETYSSVDLMKSGVYRYAESPDFEITLLAYAFDDEPVEIIEVFSEYAVLSDLPPRVRRALTDPEVLKVAHNANFERTCISKALTITLPPEQWACTMTQALMAGLPGSLDKVAKALGLQEQKQAGTALINYFAKPCKPTKINGGRTRNLPEHNPEKWEEFMAYCVQDVVVERAIGHKLATYTISDTEKRLWCLDQKINDRGVRIDTQMVYHALECDAYITDRLTTSARSVTGLDNPNSVAQLKGWIGEQTGDTPGSLDKETVQEMLKSSDNPDVQEALRLRALLSKTSTKKYAAMEAATGRGERVRGLLQYYGANRTGRWAGRLVQVQNLPRNYLPDLDLARQTLMSGDYEMLDILYGNTPDVLSQLIRTAFIPSDGKCFVVADFSSIEARVIAWLAGEQWRLDVFNTHGKIYEASAAQMFKVPIETIDKGSPLRQKGKVAELALGYQGGAGALMKMGALEMGLTEEELPELVNVWRDANISIVRLWGSVENFAKKAITTLSTVAFKYGMAFAYINGNLLIRLPSGRQLVYQNAAIETSSKGFRQIVYSGVNQTTRNWEKTETYGGKLVENIVQAIARDCLAEALLAVDAAGFDIVMHVHDEIVVEVAEDALEEVTDIMSRKLPWAPGLKLTADGFVCDYYKKD